jgi:ATP synthase F1 gamma subunit
MPSLTDLKDELADVTMLKFVSSAFTEASAARLKNIRTAFEKNQDFYKEISNLYHLVKLSAINAKKLDPKANITHEKDKNKTLCVALTSNQHFYGNINIQIIRKLVEDIKKIECEVLIVGKTGFDAMKNNRGSKAYDAMEFESDKPKPEEIQKFLDKVRPYNKVYIYHPKFVTLITQNVGVIDINQFSDPNLIDKTEEVHMIFEPELPKILDFFEHQVQNILFLRVLLETDLARTAARLLSMSAAEERSDVSMKEKSGQLRKIQLAITNRRLLETFSGINLWKK